MCGILLTNYKSVTNKSFKKALKLMNHRGPDKWKIPDANWDVEVIKNDEVSRIYYKITYKTFE